MKVDARNLEPPQPMVSILEALMNLPPNQKLIARTDRRPIHLYEQLEIRGFNGITEQLSDGSYQTHISKR
jgi:tRNA 2-thiouridine synthesizing protein A